MAKSITRGTMAETRMSDTTLEVTPKMKNWILVSVVLAVLGLGISIYSTVHHVAVMNQGSTDMACNINDTFSCDDVAKSQYSEIGGVPVAVFGIGYFAALLSLLGFGLLGGKSAREHLQAYVALVIIGVVTSVVMGAISWFSLGVLCVSCIGIYVVTVLQAGNLLAFKRELPGTWNIKELVSGLTTAAIVVALVAAVYVIADPVSDPASDSASEDIPELPAVADTAHDIPIAKSAYVGLGEDFRSGPDDAKVVVQEFADFECPACGTVSMTLDRLKQELGDRVLFVFRNYPLDSACNPTINRKMHEHACEAAALARCAGQYGKFWPAHDIIFVNQRSLDKESLIKYGKQVGLTEEQMQTCWNSPDIAAKIKDDIQLAQRIGVDSTPSIYINGKKYLGDKSYAGLRAELERQLAQ